MACNDRANEALRVSGMYGSITTMYQATVSCRIDRRHLCSILVRAAFKLAIHRIMHP